jgi:threonine dehydrogenase-like Zn-dependent dehydrogenase/glycosyltransferase involved in cell wall biosynthesis
VSPVPETSVLIRTFNEEKHLPKLLEGLDSQTYRDYELVFVDSGSYDRTRDIAACHTDRILRIDSSDFTYGYSLNVGTEACVGRFVAIVSAHTKPLNADWLGNLIAPLHEENTAMVYGRQLGWEATKFSDEIDLRRTFGSKPKLLKPPDYFAHNANSAIRKELWQRHRFDEVVPGLEDIEWAKYWMTRGFDVAYEPRAALYHIHEESWPQVRRRFYREAVAAKMIGVSSPWDAPVGLVAETGRVVSDLYRAVRTDNVFRRAPEIFSFRFNKAVGMTRGLLNGTSATDLHSKESMFFDRRCRAVVVRAAGQASLEEIELPRIKPGEVLIRVAYAGVCPIDYQIIDGTHAYLLDGTSSYPIVPGHEFSGRVVAMGVNVDSLNEGDLVVGAPIQGCGRCAECGRGSEIGCVERVEMGFSGHHGTFSEYVVLPSQFVARIPEGVDLRSASLVEPLAAVLKGLKRLTRALPPSAGNGRCLVAGAGPQGNFCAQVLALRGHEVTVYERNPARREVLASSDVAVTDTLAHLETFDVMVELTGDSQVLETMLVQSPPGATILLLEAPSAHERFSLQDPVAYDKTLVGSVGSGVAEMEEALVVLPSLELGAYLQDIVPLADFQSALTRARLRDHLKTLLQVDVE